MSSRLLSALIASLAALAAPVRAQAPQAPATYAVVSLIGDQLDAVTYQPQVGTLLDANSHQAMPMGADVMDNLALRETNKALRSTVPVADVALLAASAPEFFIDESHLFAGNQVKLPADIDAAIAQAKAGTLVLITKHRADARLRVRQGYIGSGKLEGLGFYVDTVHHLRDAENTRATGFLAPFVYIDVTLVDTASHTIIGQEDDHRIGDRHGQQQRDRCGRLGRADHRAEDVDAEPAAVEESRHGRSSAAAAGGFGSVARRHAGRLKPPARPMQKAASALRAGGLCSCATRWRARPQPLSACACPRIVSASLTSNLPGASMLSVLTTPSTTSIE